VSSVAINDALSELEALSRTQAETESRAEWTESIDRLEAEAAAISRLLAVAATVRAAGSEIAARIDAVVAAYGERISNIERQKMENRDELRSLSRRGSWPARPCCRIRGCECVGPAGSSWLDPEKRSSNLISAVG